MKTRWTMLLTLGLALGALPIASLAEPPEKAIFAGGCFWCEESAFEDLPGVISSISGYTGGHTVDPSYEKVSTGTTGHAESAEITYDPAKISYEQLLQVFWHNIDPTQADGQFCDHGSQYRSAIFYLNDAQKRAAEASKAKLEQDPRFRGKIATQIVPATTFYPAEGYHQNYCKVNPLRYKMYAAGCGRAARLKAVWGDEAGGHP